MDWALVLAFRLALAATNGRLALCAALPLPLPRRPLLCPEVLRHIRGDGQGMRLGALPKTIEERNRDCQWADYTTRDDAGRKIGMDDATILYLYVLYLFTIDPRA